MPADPLEAQYGEYLAALLRRGDLSDPAVAQLPIFSGTNEKDAAGDAVVRPGVGPTVSEALSPWTKAQTIGAGPVGRFEHTDRYREPTIRPRSTTEALHDAVRQAYEWAASTLPGRLTDAVGVTNLAGLARSQDEAPPVLRYGEAPAAVGGKRLGSLARTLRPTDTVGEYALRGPTVERITDLHGIGSTLPRANWAGSQSDELVGAFGGDQEAALRWARMWGATSPNTSVPVNTRESLSALAYSLEHPQTPFTVDQARLLPDAKITMAPSKVPNLNAALRGEPLSGDKVEAMAGFMAGEPRIPIDVHTLYGVGSKADKLDTEISALRTMMTRAEGVPLRGGLTNTEIYTRYEGALRNALQEIAPKQSLNNTFATFWEGTRAHKGLKPQGGPIDVLRNKGLLEMGAMLDPERLRAALKTAGWTAPAIAGLFAATQGTATEGTE